MRQYILLIAVLCLAIAGCDGESSSLFDPDYESDRPDPSISVIEPEDGWLAGVDTVTVRGENFSSEPSENKVYFNGFPGTILEASSTELKLRPPRQIGENLPVKMSVRFALNFSNETTYRLDQAVFPAPGSIGNDNILGIATDSEGGIYFAYQEGGIPRGIRKWDTNTNNVERLLPTQFNWSSLKIGPDGLVYGARNIFGIYRQTPAGTIDNNPFAVGNSGEAYIDMDFDEDENLWAVGNNPNIFKINIETGSVERFPFQANLRAVRYYNGKLYMGGRFSDGSETGSLEIWTMDISNGQASNPQRYLNLSDVTDVPLNLFSLTFDASGRLYIGADTGTGIYTWSDSEGFLEFYPGLVEPTGYSFAWMGEYLIASATNREESTRYALKIDVRKEGAPYFGAQQN